jgi:hypothetical protein
LAPSFFSFHSVGPLLAHYLYLAFAILFQTEAYFSP